jgi:hypothetical protein
MRRILGLVILASLVVFILFAFLDAFDPLPTLIIV